MKPMVSRLFAILLLFLCFRATASAAVTVTTDKLDYAPGEIVTIAGSGWQPGETVTLLLQENPLTHADRTLTAVADALGNIFHNSFAPEAHDVGVTFTLTATGLSSGLTAQSSFTDAELVTAEVTGTSNDVTVVQGGSTVASTINLTAMGNISNSVTSAGPSTAKLHTVYSFASGTLSSSTFSSLFNFFASGSGSGNSPITWTGAPTPYSVSASFSANSATPAGNYTITLSDENPPGTVVITNPNQTGGKLDDNTDTTIAVHVRLAAPSGLSATPVSQTQINLSWTDNSTQETDFLVESSVSAGGPFFPVGLPVGTNGTSFSDTGLTCGMTRYYRVKARKTVSGVVLDSDFSAVANATTNSCAPPLEVSVVAVPGTICSGGSSTLTATASGGTGPYTFSWSSTPAGFSSTSNPVTASPSVTTLYTVTVTDSTSATDMDTVTVTVNPNPTVSISGAPGAGIFLGTGVSLTAVGSGGTPSYSYNWTSPSSLSGDTFVDTPGLGTTTYAVTVTDANTCTGSANAVVQVWDYSLSVSPPAQTALSGCSTPYTVYATPSGDGYPASVSISFSSVLGSASTPDLPSTVNLGGSKIINVQSSAVGDSTFKVVGSPGPRDSNTATLHVYNYTITLATVPPTLPPTLSLAQNQSGSFTVTLILVSGSTGTIPAISLTVSGQPAGAAATLSPSSPLTPTLAGVSTYLNVAPDPLLPAGSHTLTVTGNTTPPSCTRTGTGMLHVVSATVSSLMRDTSCNDLPNGSDVVFAGKNLTLTATNPGGYMYNASITNTGSSTLSAVGLTITFPLPLTGTGAPDSNNGGVTPFAAWGSRPVHVYTSNPCAPGATDITPAGVTVSGGTQPLSTNSTPSGAIVVPTIDIPAGGTVWVQVHHRYNLMGTSPWPSDSPTMFRRAYQFKGNFSVLTNPAVTNFIETGKKVTAIGGYAIDLNGATKGGLGIAVAFDPSNPSCATTLTDTSAQNITGFYFVQPVPTGQSGKVLLCNAQSQPIGQQAFSALAQDEFRQIDFLNLSPADPVIEGIVGTTQAGVGRVKVELYGTGRRLIATTWTNSGGYYVFRFTSPGEYTVKITPPAGYNASTSSQTVFVRMFEELKLDFLLTQ